MLVSSPDRSPERGLAIVEPQACGLQNRAAFIGSGLSKHLFNYYPTMRDGCLQPYLLTKS